MQSEVASTTLPAGCRVTTNSYARPGRPERWSYTIHVPGWEPYTSAYRYRSQEAARLAGLEDATDSLAVEQ